jgi:hypothetical protein
MHEGGAELATLLFDEAGVGNRFMFDDDMRLIIPVDRHFEMK